MEEKAFYRDLGDGMFASTPATAGPWSPTAQHGGPPSALMGRAIDATLAGTGQQVARLTVDLPRAVPVAPLEVSTAVLRAGARTSLVEAALHADGRLVATARASAVVPGPANTPPTARPATPPPRPGPQPQAPMTGAHLGGYVSAVEWRFAHDQGFDHRGPGSVWARQRIPLVEHESPSPLTRTLCLADSTWAVAFELDQRRFFMINTDVTVALHRPPQGEWLALVAHTEWSAGGSGLAHGQVHDDRGPCGHVLQTLLIGDRAGTS